MISLTASPSRINYGEPLKIILDIQGQINLKMYKGEYFNLTIKTNGSSNLSSNNLKNSTSLYPLRFNGFPLEWDIYPNVYGCTGSDDDYYCNSSDNTFIVNCQVVNSNKNIYGLIGSTTFIVNPNNIYHNRLENINVFEGNKQSKDSQIKKQLVPIDYNMGCQIQKPGTKLIDNSNTIKSDNDSNSLNNLLISSAKVQIGSKNVNGR